MQTLHRAVLVATMLPFAATGFAQEQDTTVARGAYLVRIMGCNDCHTAG
jgi:hypothetical protein